MFINHSRALPKDNLTPGADPELKKVNKKAFVEIVGPILRKELKSGGKNAQPCLMIKLNEFFQIALEIILS